MLSVVNKVIVSIYCISRAVSYFYETEFEIWAGFGSVRQFIIHEFLVLFYNYFELSLDESIRIF